MEHVAIMKKSWGLLEKILSGQKTIESRWYKAKRKPWDAIRKWETIYFKNSGEPVTIKALVSKVGQFADLTPKKVREILNKYGKSDGIEKEKIPEFFKRFKSKKYCILVFLKNPVKINPFKIDKIGFGAMSAWISIDNIDKIKNA